MQKRKKLSALDKYAILSISVMIIYTITGIVYQFKTGEEISSTLTTCIYSAFGGELFLLCMIKRLKLKGGRTNDD